MTSAKDKDPEAAISLERIQYLMATARDFYTAILGASATPYEGLTIVTMLHLDLWLNYGEGDPEVMLDQYKQNFLDNCKKNQEYHAARLN